MGKAGGFFKRLKAQRKRARESHKRGSRGRSKSERRARHNEAVDYYAARRLGEELARVDSSSESSDGVSEDDGVSPAMAKLRALLGVSATVPITNDEDRPPSVLNESIDEETATLGDEEGEDSVGDEDEGEDGDDEGEEGDGLEVSFVAEGDTVRLPQYALRGVVAESIRDVLSASDTDPMLLRYCRDTFGPIDESAPTTIVASLEGKTPLVVRASKKARTRWDADGMAWRTMKADTTPPHMHPTVWRCWVRAQAGAGRSEAFSTEEGLYWRVLTSYANVLDVSRTFDNAPSRIDVVALHLLNHIVKAKTVMEVNDAALARRADGTSAEGDDDELRDRGFGVCRALVILPMRNAALRFVNSMLRVWGGGVEAETTTLRYDHFLRDFTDPEPPDRTFRRRPLDYRRQFEGNLDDSFCFGMRLWPPHELIRESDVREAPLCAMYSHVLNSDILVCSPLGLRRRLERHADLMVALSSVEVCVLDEAHVVYEQNWEHVEAVWDLLNRRPTSTTVGLHDVSRVYPWAVADDAKVRRQTVLLAAHQNAVVYASWKALPTNAGRLIVAPPSYTGVLGRSPVGLRQTFLRCPASSLERADDERLSFFMDSLFAHRIVPLLRRGVRVLLFVPNYPDYVRVREAIDVDHRDEVAHLMEYSTPKEQRRALGQFSDGERPLLIMSERFYFYQRYFVERADTMVFYGPPRFADSYARIVGKLNLSTPNASVVVLFNRYDAYELERLVGSTRCEAMLQRPADTYAIVCQPQGPS